MYTWLSRIMALIFLVNVLSPAYAQQSAGRSRRVTGNRNGVSSRDQFVTPGERRLQQLHNQADSLGREVQNSYEHRREYIDEYEDSLASARDAFVNAASFEEMEAAYNKMSQLRATGGSVMRMYQGQIAEQVKGQLDASNAASFEYYRQNPAFAPDAISQTMGRDMRYPYSQYMISMSAAAASAGAGSALCPSADEFLIKYEADKFESLEDYLDYVDPMGMNCEDDLVIAYASEVLFYTLQSFQAEGILEQLGLDPEDFKVFLSHARYRGLQSLRRLEKKTNITENLIMAKGTLRILLSQIDAAAKANNIQLPEKKLYYVSPTKGTWQNYKRKVESKNSGPRLVGDKWVGGRLVAAEPYEVYVQANSYFVEKLPENMPSGWKAEEVTYSSIRENDAAFTAAYNRGFLPQWAGWSVPKQNPAPKWLASAPLVNSMTDAALELGKDIPVNLENGFISELEAFKEKNPKEGDADFALLQLEMNYAAQFAALTGDSGMLDKMLGMFEKTASSEKRLTDFQNQYSAVLGVLFGTVQDTLQNLDTAGEDAVFVFLENAAGFPHGTDTRVMALAALGFLNAGSKQIYPDKQQTYPQYPYLNVKQLNNEGVITREFYLSDATRVAAAVSVMDLVAPLQRYYYQDYGLDSDQMQKLSVTLLDHLQKFLPVPGRVDTPAGNGEWNKDERLVTGGDFYGVHGGYILETGKPRILPKIYIWDKDGHGHGPVEAHDWKNSRKVNDEMDALILNVFGEAALWVLSGVVVGAAFKGLRLLVAVGRNIPRGVKAGRVVFRASKGSALTRLGKAANRAGASIKTGVKYSNNTFNAYMAQNGLSITRNVDAAGNPIVQEAVKKGAATAARGATAPSPVTSVAVRSEQAVGAARPVSPQSRFFNLNIYEPNGFGSRFTLKLGDLSGWSNPRIRAELLRKAGHLGWKPWTKADKMLAYETAWWDSYIGKIGSEALVPADIAADPYLFYLYRNAAAMNTVAGGMQPGRLFMSSPLFSGYGKAYWNTAKFFLGFQAADVLASATYKPAADAWMTRRAEEAQKAEMAQYGDVFSDEAVAARTAGAPAEAAPSPADILTSITGGAPAKKGFGWMDAITLPSWLWNQISPTRILDSDGAALSPVIVGGWNLLNKAGVMNSSPFMQDQTKQQIAINAALLRLRDAQQELADKRLARNEQTFAQSCEKARADIEKNRTEMQTIFASWGDIAAADAVEYNRLLDDYLKHINQLASSSEDVTARFRRLGEVFTTYSSKMEAFNQKFIARAAGYQKQMLARLAFERYFSQFDYVAQGYLQQFNGYPDAQQELQRLFAASRQELENIRAKGLEPEAAAGELEAWQTKLQDSLDAFDEKNANILLVQLERQVLQRIQMTKDDAAKHQTDISALAEEWKAAAEAILSSSDDIAVKQIKLQQLYYEMLGKAEELIWQTIESSGQTGTKDVDRSELYQDTGDAPPAQAY